MNIRRHFLQPAQSSSLEPVVLSLELQFLSIWASSSYVKSSSSVLIFIKFEFWNQM